MKRPAIRVAVVMERIAQPNRWEDWQHRLVEVIADDGASGTEPRLLQDDGKVSRWLHPGFEVALFADECKGYFLNLTSGAPVWFVPWRLGENDPSFARPATVSLSYIVADRWLSADEKVDTVPLQGEICEWLRVFTNENFRPDEMQERRRPQSFISPEERAKRAREAMERGRG